MGLAINSIQHILVFLFSCLPNNKQPCVITMVIPKSEMNDPSLSSYEYVCGYASFPSAYLCLTFNQRVSLSYLFCVNAFNTLLQFDIAMTEQISFFAFCIHS